MAASNDPGREPTPLAAGHSPPEEDDACPDRLFPIVGIGASAGGLEALRALFRAMPADTGAGFVLVQHLDPTHDSLMAELLTKYAQIPVVQVSDGMPVEPNRLHVIPPNSAMTILAGVLHLSEPTERRGLRMPIDRFFSSLADDRQEQAVAIVLSGTGGDGTYGVRLIKARGGMVLAQDPATAGYDGMPRSAVGTGDVDDVLPVDEMPRVLTRYIEHFRRQGASAELAKQDQDYFDSILALLIARENYDFRSYKRGTLQRRILRRMGLSHVSTLADYCARLRDDPNEVRALGKDLLIGVTSFFRDPEAWRVLGEEALPQLFAHLDSDQALRVWVPGCATGEEAYTLAMVLSEASEAAGRPNNLIVFATDVSPDALEVARSGLYAESLVAEIDADRLKRYFNREGDRYQVKKGLREQVIFAPQNLITDPPFSNLSLISCRNLMIYLEPDYQERILALFHFSLQPDGYLFLGTSETTGRESRLFEPVAKKWRIYRRLNNAAPGGLAFPRGSVRGRHLPELDERPVRPVTGYGALTQRTLIEAFAPASVLVDRGYRVLYYHGPVRDYLGPAAGDPSDELLQLTGEGMRGKLRAALRQATNEGQQIDVPDAQVRRGDQWYRVAITVTPVKEPERSSGLLLVSFRDTGKEPADGRRESAARAGEASIVQQLEEELKATREELRSTIEQMETSNEELKASNEEVMSMNEELQSTNEELETSKEELQSLNEELTTLNSQLEDKVHELEAINNDLSNLLVSTDIATLFLDRRLCIHRYTPAIEHLMRVIPSDVGRRFTDITWRFQDEHLLGDARLVLAGEPVAQQEIQTADAAWFQRRVLPYRTEDDAIEGVVVTFTEITERKRIEDALRQSESHLKRITDSLPVLISYIDTDTCYRFNNAVYAQWFGVEPETLRGMRVPEVIGDAAFARIRGPIERALAGETVHVEDWLAYGQAGERYISADFIPDKDQQGAVQGFFALTTDITERRRNDDRIANLSRERQQHLEEIQALLEAAPVGMFFGRDRGCQDMIMNREGAQMLRLPVDRNPSMTGPEVEQLAFRIFHDGRELAPAELPMQQAAARGETISGFEEVLEFADGSRVDLLAYAAPLFDEQGDVRGCVGTLVDVTEQKRLEAELRSYSQELEEVDRRKDEFLAMLGHELRNPLTPIRTTVDLLNLEGDQRVDRHWAADMIKRQLRHLERMVDDLLDLSRIRRGLLNLTWNRHELQALISESIASQQPGLNDKRQTLTTDLPETPIAISGDGTRLIQVFSNLLSNAVRYTQDGGEIWVRLDLHPDGRARVCVEDTGKGIPSDLLPHVFDILNQAPSHPDRTHAGLGLGLTLVKQIVLMHGGEVDAASDGPGQGSRFSVLLPLAHDADTEEDDKATAATLPDLDARTARTAEADPLDILIVDDNVEVLSSFEALLGALGHRVRSLDAGRKVVSAVQESPPDVVLLDLGMPDMDGYQVARDLAQLPERRRFKVIAITGYTQNERGTATTGDDFDAWLLKPITLDTLMPYLRP